MAQLTLSAKKLVDARKAGHDKLKVERERRAQRIRAFTGPDYGEKPEKSARKYYLNLVHQAARTLCAYLVPRDPKSDVKAKRLETMAESTALQYSLDGWCQETGFKRLLRRAVMEALVSPMAIIRFGLKANGEILKTTDREVDLGMPFAELVDFDDYCLDPAARNRQEAMFEAVRIVCPREKALGLPIFSSQARAIIETLPTIDEDGVAEDRQGRISPREPASYDLTDYVQLWEYFVYYDDEVFVVTMPGAEGHEEEALSIEPYQGALRGPLEVLHFTEVPGDNPMPLAPLAPLIRLSEATDEVFAKMIRQLKNAKTVFAYNRSAEEDAETIGKAKDLAGVAVDDVNAMKALPVGGIIDKFFEAINWLDGHWNTASGNLHTVGGQSDPRKTATAATQDNANAGITLTDMQATVRDLASQALRRVGFYYADDPLFRWYGLRRIRGGHLIPVQYSPEDRESDPFDHDIQVDSISMEPQDPSLRMRRLIEFLATLPQVLALPVIDPIKYMKMGARRFDEPDLEDIAIPPVQAAMQAAGAPSTPPVPGGVPKAPRPGQPQPGAPPQPGVPQQPQFGTPIDAQRSALAPVMAQ